MFRLHERKLLRRRKRGSVLSKVFEQVGAALNKSAMYSRLSFEI